MDALSETDLLRALLAEHEADHWDRWDRRRDLGLDPADQRAAVAVATLLTADGDGRGADRRPAHPSLRRGAGIPADRDRPMAGPALPACRRHRASSSSPRSNRTALARFWSATCCASTRVCWPPPSTRHRTGSSRQALTVTGRIARDDQAVRDQLRAVLDERLADLLQRALRAGDSELLAAVTSAMTISRPAQGALDAADRFPDVLPVWLRPLAADVTALAVDGLRARVSKRPGCRRRTRPDAE